MRIVSLLLVLSLLFSLAACRAEPTVPDVPTGTESTTEDTYPEGPPTGPCRAPEQPDYLPEMTYDGAEVRIWTAGGEPLVPENAIILSEGLRGRDEVMETLCDVVLRYEYAGGDSRGVEKLRQNLLSGDAYDIVDGEAVDLVPLAIQKSFLDLGDSIYIDFTQPWWLSSLTETLRVGVQHYTAAGFFSADTLSGIGVWYFSDPLTTEYALGDLHSAVEDGTWTWDRMTEMCERVSGSVNDAGDVRYGLSGRLGLWRGETAAAGYQLVTNDGKGGYTVTGVTDTLLELHEKMYPMLTASDACLSRDVNGITGAEATSLFADDRILFYQETLAWALSHSVGESSYGILPPPKYVETQADYAAACTPFVTAIPAQTKEPVRAAVLLEMLQWTSYYNVRPSFNVEVMSYRYLSDNRAIEILQRIFAAATTDFAYNALGREHTSSPLFALPVFSDPAAVFAEHAGLLETLIEE